MNVTDSPSESRTLDPSAAQAIARRLRKVADDLDEAADSEPVDVLRSARARRTSGRTVNPIVTGDAS